MSPNVTVQDIPAIQREFREEYMKLRAGCDPPGFDDATLLDLIRKLRHQLDVIDATAPFESKTMLDFRIATRRAADTLLRRAQWISRESQVALQEFRDAQPEFLDDHYRFTDDYSDNYMSIWPELLGTIAGHEHLTFVEVGSFEGMAACWLLTHVLTAQTSRLICIDPFLSDEEAGHTPTVDSYIDSAGRSVFERFLYNLRQSGGLDRVTIHKQPSQVALKTLPALSIDAAYIDGSHHSCDVIQDAILAWGALKANGLLIFDDYQWVSPDGPDPLASPKPAVDAFLMLFASKLEILHTGYQVIVKKRR